MKLVMPTITIALMLLMGMNVVAETVSIALGTGWNLISFPVEPVDSKASTVFSTIEGKYAAVYTYDVGTGNYKAYVPGDSSSTLQKIDTGRGYWVYMNSPAELSVAGEAAHGPIDLIAWWNMSGFNSVSKLPAKEAFKSVEGNLTAVYAYKNSSGQYLAYIPPSGGELTEIKPGDGLWIYANKASKWTVPQPTPTPSPNGKVLFDVDLTKGNAGGGQVIGGVWDNGWRVTDNNQRIVWDAGYNIANGYFEVTFTMKGEAVNLGGVKIDWVGIFQSKAISQNVDCGDVFYLRTGAPNFRFSQIKVFPTNKDGTGAKATTCRINEWIQSWGEVADWKTDDKTVMTVRLEWKNGEAFVIDTKGQTATCAAKCMKEINKLRYAYVGGDTYSDLSLKGLRILKIKLVDYGAAN
jgi:hypothetical protein